MVEKTINTEVKVSLQPLFRTRRIDFRCPKSYRPLAKKVKDKASQKYRDGDKDKNKAKSHNSLSTNI